VIGHLLFWFLMDQVAKAAKEEDNLRRHPGYGKVRCPSCRGWVLPKEMERKGCYLCGWKEGAQLGRARA
jgi:hypothetical protein